MAVVAVVHAVSGAMIDAQLAYSVPDGSPVSQQSGTQAVYPGNYAAAGSAVPEPVQPIRKRRPAVGRLVLTDFHCSLKATDVGSVGGPIGSI